MELTAEQQVHFASIAHTASELVRSGELDPHNIDWDLLRARHDLRMLLLFRKHGDQIIELVWRKAQAEKAAA